jgi:2,4-dienoyl-CoA reductase-like NADH-dependent reductase (Old Yellow Enzyme family)
MIAIGRELIFDLDWVDKAQQERESEIETKLKKDAQSHFLVSDLFGKAIVYIPGWFSTENERI